MTDESLGKIITFYSYKGGTGRSMALANVAWILASNEMRVLVMDWDVEAPGLHRYFHPFLDDKALVNSKGVIDFVRAFETAALTPPAGETQAPKDWYFPLTDISDYTIPLKWRFGERGVLDFVPAGRQGPAYSNRVNTFNWENFYNKLGGGVFLEAVKKKLRLSYDYVLIDSRTGVSDTAGVCTVQMPEDLLVVCFTLNSQSIEGAAAAAHSAAQQRNESKLQGPLRVFPVPMRVDIGEKTRVDLAREYAKKRFGSLLGHLSEQTSRYWKQVEVGYVPFYTLEEVLATFADESGQTHSLLYSLERLVDYITDGDISELNQSPRDQRNAVLAQYRLFNSTDNLDELVRRFPDWKELHRNAIEQAHLWEARNRPADELLTSKQLAQLRAAPELISIMNNDVGSPGTELEFAL